MNEPGIDAKAIITAAVNATSHLRGSKQTTRIVVRPRATFDPASITTLNLYSGQRPGLTAAESDDATDGNDAGVGTGEPHTVDLGSSVRLPSVSFTASEPHILSNESRKWLFRILAGTGVLALVGAGVIALTSTDGKAASVIGLVIVTITAIVLSYFTVMGFGKVEYSVGVTGSADDETDDTPDGDAEGAGGEGTPAAGDTDAEPGGGAGRADAGAEDR